MGNRNEKQRKHGQPMKGRNSEIYHSKEERTQMDTSYKGRDRNELLPHHLR